MRLDIFINFSLVITVAYTAFYGELKQRYNRVDDYQSEIKRLKNRVEEERFKHLLTSYEFMDFRQHTATILPSIIKQKGPGEKSYPARTLASVVQKNTNETHPLKSANSVFEDGKKFYREEKFELATAQFERLLRDHPYSAHIPVAMFLLVDSYLKTQNNSACISVVEKMLELYPESELTGHAMLRAGKVYELQEKHEEAIDIYKTVLKVFPSDPTLRRSAALALRAIEL